MTELEQKLSIIRTFLQTHDLDLLLLQRASSFAWATCGASSYINTASSYGEGKLLISPDAHYLITNNIEAPRFIQEERLENQGWEVKINKWYEEVDIITNLSKGRRLGSDSPYPGAKDVSAAVSRMRTNLLPVEQERLRALGKICADAMEAAIQAVHPGISEYEIAAILASETEKRGAQAIVNLIATDERIYQFRHPLPTSKKMERYAMLVLCGRWKGLVASITRLVYFGRMPDELRQKMEAVAYIDATFHQETMPGRTLSEVFQKARKAYAFTGFADQWQFHHQGGPAGYEPREFIATPDSIDIITLGQAYAWNPSVTGAKSEDTILVNENGAENITETSHLPTIEVKLENKIIKRPAILEIN